MIEFDAPSVGMVGIPSVISMQGQDTRKFGSRERQTERVELCGCYSVDPTDART